MLYPHISYRHSFNESANLINEVYMNFRPLHDRVMVKREDEEDVTKGWNNYS